MARRRCVCTPNYPQAEGLRVVSPGQRPGLEESNHPQAEGLRPSPSPSGWVGRGPEPRALPWADDSQAFGLVGGWTGIRSTVVRDCFNTNGPTRPFRSSVMGRTRTVQRDGIGSSIEPQTRGASKGRGLPPRTHAIHVVLIRADGRVTREAIENELRRFGYAEATVEKTREHLRSLEFGSESYPLSVTRVGDEYQFTPDARHRMEQGPHHHFPW
jgi:hypothetical protein